MNIYLFGNRDHKQDSLAFVVAEKLKEYFSTGSDINIRFVEILPNQDLPFVDQQQAILMDVVEGIGKVEFITEKNIDKLVLPPRTTAHDYDLGFQLKYLKKLGKINSFIIIGLPMSGDVDYERIQSTLRKLVAQDMQGS